MLHPPRTSSSRRRWLTSGVGVLLLAIALPRTAVGQHVLFEENFEGGIPPSWTQVQRGYRGDIWTPGFNLVDGSCDINHEWFCDIGFFFRDNLIVSPPIDLTGQTEAFLEFGQWQIFPTQRNYNGVEITTDGGGSFQTVYVENGTWSGFDSTQVDISAFAGHASVQVAFHYQGIIANDWSIDNFRVTSSPLHYDIQNLAAHQQATFAVTGSVPGNGVVILFSVTGPGPLMTRFGTVNLTPPFFLFPPLVADANGRASLTLTIPPAPMGLPFFSQAYDFTLPLPSPLRPTNSWALMIQ